MKFAKEIEQDLVPEWRAKYFDYKTGKKKVKAVARALRNVNATPKTPGRQLPANLLNNTLRSPAPPPNNTHARDTPQEQGKPVSEAVGDANGGQNAGAPAETAKAIGSQNGDTSPVTIPRTVSRSGTGDPLVESERWDSGEVTNYGSFVPSPSSRNGPLAPPSLELPGPALPPEEDAFAKHNRAWRQSRFNHNAHSTPVSHQLQANRGDAFHVGKTHSTGKLESSQLLPKHKRFLRPHRSVSTPHGGLHSARPRFIRRFFSASSPSTPSGDVPLEAYKLYDEKQADFYKFLDGELRKIEDFYKMKETHANRRLQSLRDQLHEMRDRRIEEIRHEQEAKKQARIRHEQTSRNSTESARGHQVADNSTVTKVTRWLKPIESAVGMGPARIGKTSRALQKLGSPSGPLPIHPPGSTRPESWRDFSRRPEREDIPHRAAKRKLKLALQEFYRGLELLKSYALLNRTAFRKINKKYDKAVKARPTQRYMTEKVNKSWFVQSEVLDHQLVAVEDLYARYFERGNHKVAVGKLRSRSSKNTDFTGSVFRNGMLLAGAAVLGIQGIVYAAEHLNHPDPTIRLNTSYVMQIYGGYFLMLFLVLLFCIDCKVWTRAKINYSFIFEFDARHNLDWHQLSEIPCFLLFLLGLTIWLNFFMSGANAMFIYWPVILIGISVIILFFPGPILYHKSREWWAYSNFRLLLAGIYPVEFRDFFLGDMYCSQTYSLGNLELFFCLYAHYWSNPAQCNSSNSRLLGFFSTLPGIWRALQCLRRYYDTRNVFPHLVNFGKYTFTILSYMTLSLYRINQTMSLKALFIACSTINSIYCSIWDLAMDWSLLNPYTSPPFLREVLGYKNPYVYYIAMILDPILRFNWIFYAIFSSNFQHSALLSFFVAFSEVCRRGMWSLFRVENEHCTNVGRFRASRDVPLPYDLPSPRSSIGPEDVDERPAEGGEGRENDDEGDQAPTPISRRHTFADADAPGGSSALEAQQTPTLRRRATLSESETPILRGIARVGTAINQAHAQDFERRRVVNVDGASTTPTATAELERSPHYGGQTVGQDSSDEEEEEEGEGELDEEERELRTAEDIADRGSSGSGEVDDVEQIVEADEGRSSGDESGGAVGGAIGRLRREERSAEREDREAERSEREGERAAGEDMLGVQDILDRRRSATGR